MYKGTRFLAVAAVPFLFGYPLARGAGGFRVPRQPRAVVLASLVASRGRAGYRVRGYSEIMGLARSHGRWSGAEKRTTFHGRFRRAGAHMDHLIRGRERDFRIRRRRVLLRTSSFLDLRSHGYAASSVNGVPACRRVELSVLAPLDASGIPSLSGKLHIRKRSAHFRRLGSGRIGRTPVLTIRETLTVGPSWYRSREVVTFSISRRRQGLRRVTVRATRVSDPGQSITLRFSESFRSYGQRGKPIALGGCGPPGNRPGVAVGGSSGTSTGGGTSLGKW